MTEASLQVELRDNTKHPSAKALRREGRVPAIFYYHGEETIPLSVDATAIRKLARSEVNVIDVVFPDGKVRKSILREIQRDPVTDTIVHLDIMGIKLTEKVKLSIPIILSGTPLGVKEGGILEHLLREVTVEGLPLDIPEHIDVDVSEMNIGDVVTLEDIPEEKFKFITEIHHAVANVIHPRVIEEVVEVEEVEGEEVEGEEEEKEGEEGGSEDA